MTLKFQEICESIPCLSSDIHYRVCVHVYYLKILLLLFSNKPTVQRDSTFNFPSFVFPSTTFYSVRRNIKTRRRLSSGWEKSVCWLNFTPFCSRARCAVVVILAWSERRICYTIDNNHIFIILLDILLTFPLHIVTYVLTPSVTSLSTWRTKIGNPWAFCFSAVSI